MAKQAFPRFPAPLALTLALALVAGAGLCRDASAQPFPQMRVWALGRPSSHSLSLACWQVLVHAPPIAATSPISVSMVVSIVVSMDVSIEVSIIVARAVRPCRNRWPTGPQSAQSLP